MFKYFFLFLLFSTGVLCASAQNLVANHSFEDFRICPVNLSQLRFTGYWLSMGTYDGSPDYFNGCAGSEIMSVPRNGMGHQEAKTGQAYAGLIAYLTTRSGKAYKLTANHREYLGARLLKPLKAGLEYNVEFSVSRAEVCEYSVANMSMLITKNRPSMDWQFVDLGYYKPQISNSTETLLNDTDSWYRISGVYTAVGGEDFITIGNFDSDAKTVKQKQKGVENYYVKGDDIPKKLRPQIAYYYVDDVVVSPVVPEEEPVFVADVSPEDAPQSESIKSEYFGDIAEGDKIVLDNIYFEFDQSVLLPVSYDELNELGRFLVKNPKVHIQISGHTDNIGATEYNFRLSQDRAAAVMSYLSVNGIENERLKFRGFGSEYPVDTNDTEEGRSKNRRVEFEIISSN